MEDEFEPDQLVEFCQRLGLGNDGYLDEKELATVCNCIGLQAPEEMLHELFVTLDTDEDGRVCLDELSQMLRGMPKIPSSPEKHKLSDEGPSTSTVSNSMMVNGGGVSGDRASFSILDPNSTGFTKSGTVLEMWSSWGIRAEDGLLLLKELGFPVSSSSRNVSLNLSDFLKALEEESHSAKDSLPLLIQTALLTYKTEAQYLRSICESMEGERDKLRSDILEAHQRSSLLAQEVDEQNARLEKNSQLVLQKMEASYAEQLVELQGKFGAEKESLQNALLLAESQLKSLEGNDSKLKGVINKLNNENSAIERELQSLNKEIRTINKAKSHLEQEISRYVDLENKLLEIERRNSESSTIADAKLKAAHDEMVLLRDQNDELSTQVESMREKVKTLKAFQEKRSTVTNKRRKGSTGGGGGSKSLTLDGYGSVGAVEVDEGTDNEYPLEKMGKFHLGDVSMFSDEVEELETSLVSCGSQPDSGTFPAGLFRTITLVGCLEGETSTDSPGGSIILPPGQNDGKHSLEREMERETILVENNTCLKLELDRSESERLLRSRNEVGTQTLEEDADVEMDDSAKDSSILSELHSRILQLETDAAVRDREGNELREQCSELESSLDLLREEYEKCEDYWHDKLDEARNIYEIDKCAMDEKFQDLLLKIKEYEEAFLTSPSYPIRLPPIEESRTYEQQVTDLEEECEGLRRELRSLKVDQDSILSNYQRQWESRAMEECGRLEQQVSVLTKKCHEYESRLSSLAEEERSNLEESGLVEMLRGRVGQLEFQIKHQEDTFRAQISQLEARARERNREKRSRSPPEVKSSSCSPQPPKFQHIWNTVHNNNNSQEAVDLNGASLLELLHQKGKAEQRVEPLAVEVTSIPTANPVGSQDPATVPVVSVSPFLIWPQRYAQPNPGPLLLDKCASLPFIPIVGGAGAGEQFPSQNNQNQPFANNVWNNPGQSQPQNYNQSVFGDPWASVPQVNPNFQSHNGPQSKKAWCHVELGWLQALRARLRQREDQVQSLQTTLHLKEKETERVIAEMRFKHESDAANWEQLMHAGQDRVRQQGDKLAHSEQAMKDLWIENGKLRTALESTEQRVVQLENLLKYHMSLAQQQQQPQHQPPQHHFGHKNPTHSPRSLPYHHQPNFM